MGSSGKVKCTFLGKDSFCNNYVNQMNQTINDSIRQLLQQKYDAKSMINQVDSFVYREQDWVKQKTQSVSKAKFLDLSIESVTLWIMINLYGHTSEGASKKEENDIICRELYKRFNPLQKKYLMTRTGLINIEALANVINEKRNYFMTNAFQKADSGWSIINESYKKVSTFPEPFREGQFGNFILINAIRFKSPDTRKAIFYFAKQYPQSSFLPIFSKILASDTIGVFGKDFSFDRKKDTTRLDVTFIKQNISLKNVLDKYAKNKPVIIDCWATWCVYCIAEFPYYAQHEKVFKENNVVKLYLSYDIQSNASAWEEISRGWKLDGVHILADKALQAEFAQLISYPLNTPVPLPRYVLLNNKHEVVDDDMVRPSDRDFEQQLCKDLKCKPTVSKQSQ
jgi:thiol-disulfide isomerase/thioredoxin